MAAPVLLTERPARVATAIVLVGPVALGVVCGLLLGWNGTAYQVLSILAIVGGIGSGLEHDGPGDGTARGLCGGLLFGTAILATSAVAGMEPLAKLPDPPAVLALITTLLGGLFGAVGGALRRRSERRAAA